MAKDKKSIREQMRDQTKDNAKNKDKGTSTFGKPFLDCSDLDTDGLFYKAKEGKNLFDIIPFIVKTKNHPKLQKGDATYLLDVWVHKKVGPKDDNFLCLKKNYGKACPVCEEREKMQSNGEDEKEVKKLYPSRRVVYNIIDKTKDDNKIQIFETNHFQFEKELLEEAESGDDGEFIVFADLEEGKTIKCRGVKEKFAGHEYIALKKFSFEDREEAYDEEFIDSAYSLDELLVIPTYEEVSGALFGMDDPDEEDDDEEEESPKKPKKPKVNDDFNDSEIPDKKPVKKKPADEEEDDDEEEEKPKKSASKKTIAKDTCPEGGKFGKDCDEYDECEDCVNREACSKAEDEAKKSAKKKPVVDDDDDED